MKTTIACLLLTIAAVRILAAEANPRALMRGKEKTNHTIILEATVNASPAEVFRNEYSSRREVPPHTPGCAPS